MAEMSTTYISTLPTGSAGGSKYLVQDDGNNTTKVTVNDAVASATAITSANSSISSINTKIGSVTLPTTAQTLTGAIAEHESDITALNGKISGFAGTGYISIGAASSFNISYSGGGNAVFFLFALNRRSGSTPFSAVVQKYSGGTNYSVLGGTTGSFTTSAISTGIAVTMPDTYFDVIIIGSIAFTLST